MKLPKPFKKQQDFLKAVFSKKYTYLLYGGAVSGGKTYLGALLFVGLANDFPGTRYAIIRRNLTTLKRTTLKTFKKFLSDNNIPCTHNKVENIITLSNGSTIEFVEADETKDSDFNKLKGLEVTAIMIDEANELAEEAFNVLITRKGRWNNKLVPGFIMLTCNPSLGWVKDRFYEPWESKKIKEPYYYLPSFPTDNPYNTKEYLRSLEDLPESEYNRYVLGDWNFSNDPNQLIQYEWIMKVIDSGESVDKLSLDVAREGDDRTVLAGGNKDSLSFLKEIKSTNLEQTAEEVELEMTNYNVGYEDVIIDKVGVGGGVVDHLWTKGLQVKEYSGGSKPSSATRHFSFGNKRAEDFWNLRELIRKEEITIIDNKQLIKELTNIKYFVDEKTIKIEPKSAIKKRLGYSPDYADAVAMLFSKKPETSVTLSSEETPIQPFETVQMLDNAF